MLKKLSWVKRNMRAKLHRKFWNRILRKHHKWRRVDKAINASNFLYRNWIHIWELVVAILLSFSTFIFGNWTATPNNQELLYPLQEVSTLECRVNAWDTLSENCKIQLPIIIKQPRLCSIWNMAMEGRLLTATVRALIQQEPLADGQYWKCF